MLGWGVAAEGALDWSTTYLPGNKTYSATDGSTMATTMVSGWADNTEGTTLDDVSSIVSLESPGLGTDRSGEDPPDHAVDGNGPDEDLGLSFRDKAALMSLTIGWAGESRGLYPQVHPAYSNRTSSNTDGMPVVAWKLVSTAKAIENIPLDFNTDESPTSSFWLVTAAPTVVASPTCNKYRGSRRSVPCATKDNDYVKLAALSGTNTPPPGPGLDPGVPAPAPLLLMGIGLPLLRLCRRGR
jgi:hypothetical protein